MSPETLVNVWPATVKVVLLIFVSLVSGFVCVTSISLTIYRPYASPIVSYFAKKNIFSQNRLTLVARRRNVRLCRTHDTTQRHGWYSVIYYTLATQSAQSQPVLSGLSPLDSSRGVRVVKDVLKVGTWKAGSGEWVVTDSTLIQLANDFAAMQKAGVKSSLYWGSRPDGGPMGQHGVEAKNAIAPIDQVFVQDGVLYCSAYVTDEQAKLLSNPAHQVSVGVQPNWTDGAQKKYALALLHVAIVDQPVVTGQGPFLTLSNESVKQNDEDVMTPELKLMLENLAEQSKKQTEAFIALSNEFIALKAETATAKANAAKDAWSGKLNELFKANKINAATLKQYEELGQSAQFNLALLTPLDGIVMLANDGRSQSLASGAEPEVGKADAIEPDSVIEARLKAKGIDVSLMPKAGI